MGTFCNFIVVIHTVMNECKYKINHVSARVITENVWIKKGTIDTLFIKYSPWTTARRASFWNPCWRA